MRRLLKRQEFLFVRDGRKASSANMTLQARARRDDSQGEPRAGLTVTKKVGHAVIRNRIRRRLRAALLEAAPQARSGHDYVVVARSPALTAPYTTLVGDLISAFGRVHTDRKGPAGRASAAGEADR